jgi:hypothetical protein
VADLEQVRRGCGAGVNHPFRWGRVVVAARPRIAAAAAQRTAVDGGLAAPTQLVAQRSRFTTTAVTTAG